MEVTRMTIEFDRQLDPEAINWLIAEIGIAADAQEAKAVVTSETVEIEVPEEMQNVDEDPR